jgi:hypothetical protein
MASIYSDPLEAGNPIGVMISAEVVVERVSAAVSHFMKKNIYLHMGLYSYPRLSPRLVSQALTEG